MQLNISSDYAIRAMLFLALTPDIVNAADIAAAMSIPLNTCKRNLQLLKKAGLVATFSGAAGGYVLAKQSREIHLSDILRAMGEKLEINRCLESDCFCNRSAAESCPVRHAYSQGQAALDAVFATTLEELAQR